MKATIRSIANQSLNGEVTRDNRHRTSLKSPRNIWWFQIDFSGQISLLFQIVIVSMSLIMAAAMVSALLFKTKIIFGQRSLIIIPTCLKQNIDLGLFSLISESETLKSSPGE